MTKLKNSCLKDQPFTSALAKIEQHAGFPPKLALEIGKFMKALRDRIEDVQDEFNTLVKKYCHLTKDGEIDHKDKPGQYHIKKELIPKWEDAYDAFEALEFKINAPRFQLSDLERVGLTPVQMAALEPLIGESLEIASAADVKKFAGKKGGLKSLPKDH